MPRPRSSTRHQPSLTIGQHHGDLRRALLRAALGMVAAGEVGTLSLREVARRAGVSSGAPYHHFPDKQALLQALAEEGFERLERALQRAADVGRTSHTKLSRMVAEYVRFAVANPGHYRIMFASWHGDAAASPSLAGPALNAFSCWADAVSAVCAELSVAEQGRRAVFTWGLARGVVEMQLDGALHHLLDADAEQLEVHLGAEVVRVASDA